MRDDDALPDDERLVEELVSLHGHILANDEAPTNVPAEFAEELGSAAELFQLIERVSHDENGHDENGDTARDASTLLSDQSQTARSNIVYSESGSEAPQTLQRIGRFAIEKELGRGGYGIVFLAHDTDLNRHVALKVPRPEAIFTDEMRTRFLREGKAAALLSHPHVVPVFETGRVGHVCYTVSRYIPGITLAQWLATHERVPADQAAQLVATLADAVQHAHSKGVVHRDLKPSNVLLESSCHDAALTSAELPVTARVADFGLARTSLDGDGLTASNAIVGTPAYMSPEQALGANGNVNEATDVYSLGAILYELLTGRPPFQGESVVQTLRQVQEREPAAPRRLNPTVSRDLEAICLKCLEKDPRRRFASAAALKNDLENYLAGGPVEARPVTTMERCWRWSRRNRTLAAALVALLASVVVGATLFGFQFRKTLLANDQLQLKNESLRVSNQRLTEARDEAQTIATFLAESFSRADPEQDGRQVTLASMLDRQFQLVKSRDELNPRTRASLAFSLGRAYHGLGLVEDAITAYHFSEAQLAGEDEANPLRLDVNGQLGYAYVEAGRNEDAIELLEEQIEFSRASDASDNSTGILENHLALAYKRAGQEDRAVAIMERLFRALDAQHDAPVFYRHQTTANYGLVLAHLGRSEEAIPLLEESLRQARQLFGDEDPRTLMNAENLAVSYLNADRLADAEPLIRANLSLRRAVLGEDHPTLLHTENNLAGLLLKSGQVEKALQLFERLVPRFQRIVGQNHPRTLGTMFNLGGAYLWSQRPDEAANVFREVYRQMGATHGGDHPLTVKSYELLGRALTEAGENAEAEQVLADLLERERDRDPQKPGRISKMLWLLSTALVNQGKDSEAEPLLRESIGLCDEHGVDHWQYADAQSLLGYVLVRLGKPEEGKQLLETGNANLQAAASGIPVPRRDAVLAAAARRLEVVP